MSVTVVKADGEQRAAMVKTNNHKSVNRRGIKGSID
jgi:hypothetical protein